VWNWILPKDVNVTQSFPRIVRLIGVINLGPKSDMYVDHKHLKDIFAEVHFKLVTSLLG